MSFINELDEIENDPRYAQLAPDIRTAVLDNWEKAASSGKTGVEAEASASAARILLDARQSKLKARLPASPLGTLADVPPPLAALTSDPRWGTLDPTVRKQTIDNWAGAKAQTAIAAGFRPSEAVSTYQEIVQGQVMAEAPEKPDEAFQARLAADTKEVFDIAKDPAIRAGGFRAGKVGDKFVVNPALALAGEDEYAKAVDESDATPVEKIRAKALYGAGRATSLSSMLDVTRSAVSDSRPITDAEKSDYWRNVNAKPSERDPGFQVNTDIGRWTKPTVIIGGKTVDFEDAAEIAFTPSRLANYDKKGATQESLFSTNEGVRKAAEIRTAQQLATHVLPAIGADAAAARVLENPEGPEAKALVEAHRDNLKRELWVKAGNIDNNAFEKGRMLSDGTPVFNPNWARSNPDPKDIEDVVQKVGITASVEDVKASIKDEARASASRLVLRAGLEDQASARPSSWLPSLATITPLTAELSDIAFNALPEKFRDYVATKQKAGETDPLVIVDGYEKKYGMLTDDISIALRKAVSQTKSVAAGVSGILGTAAEQFGGANSTSKFLSGLAADIVKETAEAEQLQSELTGSNAGFGSTVTQSVTTELPFMLAGVVAGRLAAGARVTAARLATPAVKEAAFRRTMGIAASMTPELAASAEALIGSGSGILKTYFGLQASRSFGGVYASTYSAQKERALRMGKTEEEADRDARVTSILPSIAGGVATAVLMKMFPGGTEAAMRSLATNESIEAVLARAGASVGTKAGNNVIVNAFRNVQALRSTRDFTRKFFAQDALKRIGLKTFAGMTDEALEETVDEAFQGMLGTIYDERMTLQDVVGNALQAGGIGALIGGGSTGIASYKEHLKVIRNARKNKPVSPDVAPTIADLEANGDTATAEALRRAAAAPDNFQVALDKLNAVDETSGKGRFAFAFESAQEDDEDDGVPIASYVVGTPDPDPVKAAANMAATVATIEAAIAADPDLKDVLIVSADAANGRVTVSPSATAVASWAAASAPSAPVLSYEQQFSEWQRASIAAAGKAGNAEYDAAEEKYQAALKASGTALSSLGLGTRPYELALAGDRTAKTPKWQEEFSKLPGDVQANVTAARAKTAAVSQALAARSAVLDKMFASTKPANPKAAKAPKAKTAPEAAPGAAPAPAEVDIDPALPVSDADIEKGVTASSKTTYDMANDDPRWKGVDALIAEATDILKRTAAAINKKAADLRAKGQLTPSLLETYRKWYADLEQAVRDSKWTTANGLLKRLRDKLNDDSLIFKTRHSEVMAAPKAAKPAPEPKAAKEPKPEKAKPVVPPLEDVDGVTLPEGATEEQKALFTQLKAALKAFPESSRVRVNKLVTDMRAGISNLAGQLAITLADVKASLRSMDPDLRAVVAKAVGFDSYAALSDGWVKLPKGKRAASRAETVSVESADTRGEDEEDAPAKPKVVRLRPGKQPSRAPTRWKEKVGDALMEELRAAVNATSIARVEWGHVAVVGEELRNRVNNALYESQVVGEDEEEGLRLQNHLNVVAALTVAEDPEGTVDSLKVPKADRGDIESIDTPGKIAERLVYAPRGKGASIVQSQAGSSLAGQDMSALQPGIAAELSWKAYLWTLGRRIEADPDGDHTADLERAERLFDALIANGLWKKLAGKKEDFLLAVRTPNASLDPDYKHTNTVRYLLRQPIPGLKRALVKTGAKRLQSGSTAQQKEREKNTLRDEEANAAMVTQSADQESPLKDKIDAAVSEYLESIRQFFEDNGSPAPSEEVLGKAAAAQAAKDVEKRELTAAETLALRKVSVAKDRATGKLKTREAETRPEELDAVRAAFDDALAALGGDITTNLNGVLGRIAADKGNPLSELAGILLKANAASYVAGIKIIDDPAQGPAFYDPEKRTITFNRASASTRGFTDDIVHEVLHAATDSFLSTVHPEGSPEAAIVQRILDLQEAVRKRFKAAAPSWKEALGSETILESGFFADLVALRASTLLDSDKRAWLEENAVEGYEADMTEDAVADLFLEASIKDASTRRDGLVEILRDFEYALGESGTPEYYPSGISKEFITLMYTSPVFQEAVQNAPELNARDAEGTFKKFVRAVRSFVGTLIKGKTTAPAKVPDYSVLRDLLAAQGEVRPVSARRPGPIVAPVIAPPVITPPRAPAIAKPRRPTFGAAKPAPTPVAPAPTVTFVTELGSVYTVSPDGTTERVKAERNLPGHEGDKGAKQRSVRTVYFDASASALSAAGMTYPEGAKPRVVLKDGTATLTWIANGKRGSAKAGTQVPFYTEPAVGRFPLELWQPRNDVPGYEAYAGMHAGNKIVEVKAPAPAVEAAPVVEAAPAPLAVVRKVANFSVPPLYRTREFTSVFGQAIDRAVAAAGFSRDFSQVIIEVEATELEREAKAEDEAVASLAPVTKIEEAGNLASLPDDASVEDIAEAAPRTAAASVALAAVYKEFGAWSAAVKRRLGAAMGRFARTMWNGLKAVAAIGLAASMYMGPLSPDTSAEGNPTAAQLQEELTQDELVAASVSVGAVTQPNAYPSTETRPAPEITDVEFSQGFRTGATAALNKVDFQKTHYVQFGDEFNAMALEATPLTPAMKSLTSLMGQKEGTRATGPNRLLAPIFRHGGIRGSQDEIPWCAMSVSYALTKAGAPTHNVFASQFLSTGKRVDTPQVGDVVVFNKRNEKDNSIDTGTAGHVGFFMADLGNYILVLDGNVEDKVAITAISKRRFMQYRRITTPGTRAPFTVTLSQGAANRMAAGFATEDDILEAQEQIQEVIEDEHAAFWGTAPRVLGTYAGQKSVMNLTPERRAFMEDSLKTAQAMAASGRNREEIRILTGWFPNPYDNKMRWEIPDNGARFISLDDYNAAATRTYGGPAFTSLSIQSAEAKMNKGEVLRLSDVMEHPELFAAYPGAKDIPFFPIRGLGSNASFRTVGGKPMITATVTTDNGAISDDTLSSVLHEVQHYIQTEEGFAIGGSANGLVSQADLRDASKLREARTALNKYQRDLGFFTRALGEEAAKKGFAGFGGPSKKRLEFLNQEIASLTESVNAVWAALKTNLSIDEGSARASLLSAINRVEDVLGPAWVLSDRNKGLDMLYRSIAGEIEARDVEARKDLTPEQRAATAPYSSENISSDEAIVRFNEPQVLGTRRRESPVRRLPQALRDALPEDEIQDIEDMYNVATGSSHQSPFTLDDAIYAGRPTRMALTWLLNEDLRRLISSGNANEGARAADLSHALAVLTESGGDVAGKSVTEIYDMQTAPGLREASLKAFTPLGLTVKSRIASTPGFFTPRALRIDSKFHATTNALSAARNILSSVAGSTSPDTLVWKLMTARDPAKILSLVPEASRPALEAARSTLRSNYAEISGKSLATLTGMPELWDLASRLEALKEAAVNPTATADSRGMMIPRLAAVLKEAGLDAAEILPVRQQMATYKDDAARFSNTVSEAARTAVNRFAMGRKLSAARLEFMSAGSEALAFRDKAQGLVYKIKLPQRMGSDTGFSFDVAPPTAAPEEGEVLFNLTEGLGRSPLWQELNEMHTAVPGIVDHEVVGFTDFGALITVQKDVRGQAYSPSEDAGVIEEWMEVTGARKIPAGRLYSEDFARDATSNAFSIVDAAGFTRILADVRPANASVLNGAFLLFDPAISPAVEGEAKGMLGTRARSSRRTIPIVSSLLSIGKDKVTRNKEVEAALGITNMSRWISDKGKWGDLYKVQKELENNVQRAVTLTQTLFSSITSRMDKAGLNGRNMTAQQKRQAEDVNTVLGTIATLRDEQAAQAAEKERSRERRRTAFGVAQRRKLADQMTAANRATELVSIATEANVSYARIETAYQDAILEAERTATQAFVQKQAEAAQRLRSDNLVPVLEAAQNLRKHLNELSTLIQATTGADSRVRAHYNARFGIHLSQYYEIHDNPAYASWLWSNDPEAVKVRAAGLTWIRNARATKFAADLKSRMRGATNQEIERAAKDLASKLDNAGLMLELEDIIQKHTNRGGVGGVGMPGLLNGSILMERMNVPPELRELLGEYKDNVAVAARTALEMGVYYANYVYLDGVRVELQTRQNERDARITELQNKISSAKPLTSEEDAELTRLKRTMFITHDPTLAQEYGLELFIPGTTMINKAAFGPLQGFYGPPITVEAMRDLEGGGGTNAILNGYAELLGITMKSFTVWNLRGQARNFLSSIAFIPASGHISIPVWRKSGLSGDNKASDFFKQFGALGNARLKDRIEAVGLEKAMAEFTDMYIKRGIVGGSDAAVFREEMRKVAGKDYGAAISRVLSQYNASAATVTTAAVPFAEVFKAIDRFMTEVHRGSDDYFKKILFELEYTARLEEFGVKIEKGLPVMTDKAARRIIQVYGDKELLTPSNIAEVGSDEKAKALLLMEVVSAEATFSKIPYYNRLPEVVNAFKRQKLGLVTAPFISWPAAIWSQPYKAFKTFQQDHAVPETRDRAVKTAIAYGATAIGWNTFVGTTLSAIVWAIAQLGFGDEDKKIRPVFGVNSDQSRALQDFLNKDFYKYRSIALLGMRGDNPVWADVSWMNPWSTITDVGTPFFHPRALESGTDFSDAMKASIDKVLKTVLSPQIPISNAFDALTADDFRTKNASFGEKLLKVTGAALAPLVPMTLKDMSKVYYAAGTERFATEAVSTVLGLKINETDIRDVLAKTARSVAAQDSDTMDRYRRLLTNGRADDIGKLEDTYQEGMDDMRRLYLDLYQKMSSAAVFIPGADANKIIREEGKGLGFARLAELEKGVLSGWKPGQTTLERAARMAQKEGGDDRVRKANELVEQYGVQSLR